MECPVGQCKLSVSRLLGVNMKYFIFSLLFSCLFSFHRLLGDLNGDGQIDILDVVLMVDWIISSDVFSDEQLLVADFNGDSSIDVLDVISLINMILYGPEFVQMTMPDTVNLVEDEIPGTIWDNLEQYRTDGGQQDVWFSIQMENNTEMLNSEIQQDGNGLWHLLREFYAPNGNGIAQVNIGMHGPHSSTYELVNMNVAPVNDPPTVEGEIQNYQILPNQSVQINLADIFEDIDTPNLQYDIPGLQNATYEVVNDVMTITPDENWEGTLENLVVEAFDGEFTAQSNEFDVAVVPPPTTQLTVYVQGFYEQNLLEGTSTVTIGDSTFTTNNGTITVTMPQGTYEFNATNPNTWDGQMWWTADNYLGITRPGDIKPFETRHGDDNTSPVTLDAEIDTLYANKIDTNFPLGEVVTDLGSTIIAFGESNQDAPLVIDTNYELPDDIRTQWIHDYVSDIQAIPWVTLELPIQYLNEMPATPHMWLGFSNEFPPPGTNHTEWNDNYEITEAHARFPLWPTKYTLYIEIFQAMFRGIDDPPVLYNNGGNDVGFNARGQRDIAFSSFFKAGFWTTATEPGLLINGMNKEERENALRTNPKNTSSTLGDDVQIEYSTK